MKGRLLALAVTILLCSAISAGAQEVTSPLSQDELDYIGENIHILYDRGILKGYPDGEFAGDNLVTRFEAGVILTRFYSNLLDEANDRGIWIMEFVDIRYPLDSSMDMEDIPVNHWAYQEIQALEHMGVALGYPEWQYQGSKQVSRYELAVMLLRVVVLVDFALWESVPGYDAGFTSSHLAKPELIEGAPEEYWAQADVRTLINREPVLTASDDTVPEVQTLTRNEFVLYLLHMLEKYDSELDRIEEFMSR